MEELIKYMRALLLLQLQVAQIHARDGLNLRPELLLSDAGFAARDISMMLGKSPAAVAKAISRARQGRRAADDPTAVKNDEAQDAK